ncbi:MAG TPA: coenzyme F420-0:L-glutamate ligase [Candidatus Korarchaeota archaeon]|nr:coenzyme F420-0:L-glutamate ligase [Candidatus Korarchaeota archaeon]
MAKKVQVIGLETIPDIKAGDDLAKIIVEAAMKEGVGIENGDIIVITHKIVSKSLGLVFDLNEIEPSERAKEIAQKTRKDPEFVELILREARRIVKVRPPYIITETHFGHICLNAGIDRSNVCGDPWICATLPKDPDKEARRLREKLERLTGKRLAVIISDTYSRPHRYAQIDMAIGVSGMKPVKDYKRKLDAYGYRLRFKMQAVADEIAGAAELVIGQTKEKIPVAIIRGYDFESDDNASARQLSLIELGYKDIFEDIKLIPKPASRNSKGK